MRAPPGQLEQMATGSTAVASAWHAKYGLSPNHVAIVPLGHPEQGASPHAEPWEGVALTAWVDRRVFVAPESSH